MDDDGQLYRDSFTDEVFSREDLRDAWQSDCAELRSYREDPDEDESAEWDYEDICTFADWLCDNGRYFPIEEWEGDDPEYAKTLDRRVAEAQNGHVVTLYRYFDDRLLTHPELVEKLKIHAEVGDDYDWADYIFRASQVGTFRKIEALAKVSTYYMLGSVRTHYDEWKADYLTDARFEAARQSTPDFDDYLKFQVQQGCRPVQVLQYISGEGSGESKIFEERVIVD